MSVIGLVKIAASSVPTPPSGEENFFLDVADDKFKKKLPDGSLSIVESGVAAVASVFGRSGSVVSANGDYIAAQITNTPAGNISAITVQAAINELDAEKAPIGHVGSIGTGAHGVADGANAGFMSPSDFTKLAGVATGATANDTDANLKNRANHTGTQLAGTISDFNSAADARADLKVQAHELASDPHPQYTTASEAASAAPVQSVAGKTGAVTLVKGDVGLGNVDNVADVNKPVSTAQAAADAATLASANAYTDVQVAALVDSAPAALDTLNELAAALGDDANFATTTATALGNRLRVDTDAQALTSGEKLNAKTNIDLQNVNNTSDANKPVSTAQAAADTAVQNFSVQRANHTGTQLAATVSDFNSAADARAAIGDAAHVAASDPHTQYVKKAGDTLTGGLEMANTAGLGFVGFAPQATVPPAPASGFRFYSGSTGRLAFKGVANIPWSIDYLGLTATRTFTLPDVTGTVMIDPATTVGDLLYRNGSNITARLPIGPTDSILRVVSGLPAWQAENLTQDFGDGSDGNVTVTGALTLTQIMYYDTLTVGAGALINTNGFPIYCKTLDLTNAPAGSIFRNGAAGATVAGNAGGAGGAAIAASVLGGSAAGSAGAAGATNAGVASAAAGSANPANGGNGGNSGASGAGGTGALAAAGAGGTSSNYTHLGRFEYQFLRGPTLISGGSGGDGGNSGGGDGANSSRGAGGGGGGAGVLVIYAANIITGGSTPSGVIQAMGGNGGSGAAAPLGNVGGSGGSGGGGGGFVYLAYVTKTGASVSNLINASGGNGSNAGNGIGTGVGGNGGQGGNGGTIQTYNVSTGLGTQTIGVAGNLGTNGSGVSGGAGGNGGACTLTL